MGCCVSKKRGEPPGAPGEADGRKAVEARDLPPPEEEKVKEVLSETPRVKPRPRPRRVAGGAVVAPSAEKARAKDGVDGARVRRAAGGSRSVEEKSEAASESSAATTVAGPERSPSKPPRCRQGRSAPGGEPRRARRDRDHGTAVPGGRGRASPSPPPPRRDPGRRSPSPAAKRAQDQRGDTASSASCAQRKPPVPSRPCGRAPTPPRAQETPPQPAPATSKPRPHGPPTHCSSPPTPKAPEQEDLGTHMDTHTPPGSDGDAAAGEGEGEGKESLENPLVSMECFIFL
uniref:Serine/arginine repetitive matrix protein 1-like n=1 Tax=Hordeum vulgare subsp. vulgare TaxID=112509 RepID=A0A8I6WDN2_HORVV